MKKLLFTIWATLCSIFVFASYQSGYIIKNEGDTIRGEILLRTDKQNARACYFRFIGSKQTQIYSPSEIASYRFSDGKFYISRTIHINGNPTHIFLEYLVNGTLNLYYYQSEFVAYYFLEDEQGNMVEINNIPVRKEKEGRAYSAKNDRYKGTLNYVMRDWKGAKIKTENLKLNHTDMVGIVQDYHNAVCNTGEKCITYKSNDPTPLVVNYSVYVGGSFFVPIVSLPTDLDLQRNLDSGHATQMGFQFGFCSPRLMKSLSFNVDLSLAYMKCLWEIYSHYHDPFFDVLYQKKTGQASQDLLLSGLRLGVRYTYDKYRFQPFFEPLFGISLYLFNQIKADGKVYKNKTGAGVFSYYSIDLSAGVQYRLKNHNYIFLQGMWNVLNRQNFGLRIGYTF